MMKLEELEVEARMRGVVAGKVVQLLNIKLLGPDARKVTYECEGETGQTTLFRSHEAELEVVEVGRTRALDADPETFKLAAEAERISRAHLYDPMLAIHTSNVRPLPHQLTAVYEAMLPKRPLRFVLADDPGAGKTVMAGLLIRELQARGDVRRCLVVTPGSLVEQWQDEMNEKFGLHFDIFTRDMLGASRTGNPFKEHDLMLARLDMLSRNDEFKRLLEDTDWDLIIVDEAHRMSAAYWGGELKATERYKLGQLLGKQTRHLLLMTATPHNGKDKDFHAFMALLDEDRFYGETREGASKLDISDVMRRLQKEQLVTFDGKKLFPERRARALEYELSDGEAQLYEAVTTYVRTEMNRADNIVDGQKRGQVGFALTVLQRRLASSPEAISQSLKRRHARLQQRRDETETLRRGREINEALGIQIDFRKVDDELEEQAADELETMEEELVDRASAARTLVELDAELASLQGLVTLAQQVLTEERDSKWARLSELLLGEEMMRPDGEGRRKLIIFTEHRDTLRYLHSRITALLGSPDGVLSIHGGTPRDVRRGVQDRFRTDPTAVVLLATDAAGEGVNLQVANLMINYDLPWNPNRLEQRFGRIHRIGQTEVCHLWNLVAKGTREGDVYLTLLQKLEVAREALGGQVFDVLGELFEERSLREMLIDAVRSEDHSKTSDALKQTVDKALSKEHIQSLLDKHALVKQSLTAESVFQIREQMEQAALRRLQPHYIERFFLQAMRHVAGTVRQVPGEPGRWTIRDVPYDVREEGRRLGAREAVQKTYDRVCFEQDHIRPQTGQMQADLLHPGHPLMQALLRRVQVCHLDALQQGTMLLNRQDLGDEPRLLCIIDDVLEEGGDTGLKVSERLHMVELYPDGRAQHAGYAPYLDYDPMPAGYEEQVGELLRSPWLEGDLEELALTHATQHLTQPHFDEVLRWRTELANRTELAVTERLEAQIKQDRNTYLLVQREEQEGKKPRISAKTLNERVSEMVERLQRRLEELARQRTLKARPARVLALALVIPGGLVERWRQAAQGVPEAEAVAMFASDAAARARVERVAMQQVMTTETALGNRCEDVSARKCGWDITVRTHDGQFRFVEVKGRAKGAETVTITRNEILFALNQPEQFELAIVLVDGELGDGPYYVTEPFKHVPDPAASSVNYDLKRLLRSARKAEAPRA